MKSGSLAGASRRSAVTYCQSALPVAGENGQAAFLVALPEGQDAPILDVEVADLEIAQLGGAQAAIDEQEQDGLIPARRWPGCDRTPVCRAGCRIGSVRRR